MATLLASLETMLHTVKGVASNLQAGDAKFHLLTLIQLIVPLDKLVSEIYKPHHELQSTWKLSHIQLYLPTFCKLTPVA